MLGKTLVLLSLTLILSAAVLACTPKQLVNANETPNVPAAETAEAETADLNGTYSNSGGATLTIHDFEAEKGFEFQLKIVSEDDCGGIDYSGAATFSDPNTAASDMEDLFKFDEGKLQLEPSMEMIGMDCARVIDVEFVRQ